jgi:hypothetical protein
MIVATVTTIEMAITVASITGNEGIDVMLSVPFWTKPSSMKSDWRQPVADSFLTPAIIAYT